MRGSGWAGAFGGLVVGAACLLLSGCASAYPGVVRPTVRMSALSPELGGLTDEAIETYLRAHARPAFPTVLAIAKLRPGEWDYRQRADSSASAAPITGEEADGWRAFVAGAQDGPIEQVQLISALLVANPTTLKSLRDSAALVHAPLLLVYMQEDARASGYNDLGMAYWTIVGLFCVPGNRVGCHSVCQAVLVDTRSGYVLATAEGEGKAEENVLPGAVDIAQDRVRAAASDGAVRDLQSRLRVIIRKLSKPEE